jgi:hypothetical protein
MESRLYPATTISPLFHPNIKKKIVNKAAKNKTQKFIIETNFAVIKDLVEIFISIKITSLKKSFSLFINFRPFNSFF